MKRIILLSVSVLTLLLFIQIDVLACSCPINSETLEQETKARLKNAKAVFSGEVIEINKIPKSNLVTVKIKVKRSWKNALPEQINITSEFADGASCGYHFQKGKSYLVFAQGSDVSNLNTGLCSFNREIENAIKELKILGKGKKPNKSKK